ncbi:MAG: hypothetical protein FJ313_04255 [Gemmatimonadetes bacterium]|nr:hypothetical protein [Gemmatimonadota bacterium]
MRSTRPRTVALLALVAAASAARAADIPDFTPEQMGGTLFRNMNAEPQNLNPLTGKDLYERYVNEYIFEYLIERDADTTELKGMLARRWDLSPDGRVITFHLDPRARFSDGRPLTADDVVFSYETVRNPQIDCRSAASYLEDCERCEKIDDHTVRFTWKKTYFKTLESSGNLFPILPRHLYERNVRADPGTKDGPGRHFNNLTQGFIGSGPYTFAHWKTGQEIALVRNETYWGKPRAFDRIVFRLVIEEQASVQAFLSGDLDDLTVTPEWWVRLQAHPDRDRKFRMFRYVSPANGYSYIGWNNVRYRPQRQADGSEKPVAEPHPIFGDRRVRRAMTHLVDRETLRKCLYYDVGRVATGPFWPFGVQADPSVKPWPFDRVEALRLLKEAGWEDRDGDGWLEDPQGRRLSFEFTIPSGTQLTRDLARVLVEEFRRTGIEVRPAFVTWSVFITRLDNRDFDAVTLAWGGGGVEGDPYQIWHSDQMADQGHNFIGFRHPEADRLITAARGELDAARRNDLFHQFHRLLHEEQPYTFFIDRESLRLVSTRIQGIKVHRLGMETQEWWIPREHRRRPGEVAR